MPLASGVDEGAEECARKLVLLVSAFWMPLHADDEVFWRSVLYGFHDAVFRTVRDLYESIAGLEHRLVMAGVNADFRRAFLLIDGFAHDAQQMRAALHDDWDARGVAPGAIRRDANV